MLKRKIHRSNKRSENIHQFLAHRIYFQNREKNRKKNFYLIVQFFFFVNKQAKQTHSSETLSPHDSGLRETIPEIEQEENYGGNYFEIRCHVLCSATAAKKEQTLVKWWKQQEISS